MHGSSVAAKREEGQGVARLLVEAGVGVQAILLFGSVARGDAGPDSDIDLMAVSEDPLRREMLSGRLGGSTSVSLVCHTWESLRRARDDDWSFFVHLREEGEVLHEFEPRLRRELDAVRRPSLEVRKASLRSELRCLERYEDLSRFRAGHLFPLARIFRVARYICMLDNTAEGHIAFRREDAFSLFAERRSCRAADVELVSRLWPFQARTQGRGRELPFPVEDSQQVTESVRAAQRIARATLGDSA